MTCENTIFPVYMHPSFQKVTETGYNRVEVDAGHLSLYHTLVKPVTRFWASNVGTAVQADIFSLWTNPSLPPYFEDKNALQRNWLQGFALESRLPGWDQIRELEVSDSTLPKSGASEPIEPGMEYLVRTAICRKWFGRFH